MLSTADPSFKPKLTQRRIARKLSGAELARRIGISEGMIARYESTTRKDRVLPNPDTLKRINEVLFPDTEEAIATELVAQTIEKPAPESQQNPQQVADSLPLEVLIKALKKRGGKVMF